MDSNKYHIMTDKEKVEAIKRGEKYKEMWGELIEEYGEYVIRMNYENKPLCVRMDKIKQKYFPKEE